jgi:simple sugar transport system permease protein
VPLLVAATLNAGTVLAFAALGLLINERAGIVNLGAEGHDARSPRSRASRPSCHTGNDWLGFAAGALAGALLAAAFGVLVIWLNTNQYASGLALSLFGVGFSAFVGIRYTQEKLGERPNFEIPGLADFPSSARRCSASIRWSTSRSRSPSRSPGSSTARAPGWCCARSASRPSRRTRSAIRCGGSASSRCCSAARSAASRALRLDRLHAALGRGDDRRQGLDRARLTTFATWRPARVLLGAYLFGGVTMLQFHLQGEGRAGAEPVPHDAAVPGDDRRPGADLAQRHVHPRQHAGVDRKTVLPRLIIVASPRGRAAFHHQEPP